MIRNDEQRFGDSDIRGGDTSPLKMEYRPAIQPNPELAE
jgi:hypothetical protein